MINMTIQRTKEIFRGKMDNWTDEQVKAFIANMSGIVDCLMANGFKSLTNRVKSGKN